MDLIKHELSDDEVLRSCIARMTPERRGVAVVIYDPDFAQWQIQNDPLVMALVRLYGELTSPYNDVPVDQKSVRNTIVELEF